MHVEKVLVEGNNRLLSLFQVIMLYLCIYAFIKKLIVYTLLERN